ncbi:MAG: hypothetical protein GY812_03195 [Actinomycetia bacterium]|nr:hypothetical protein [Actinomycetes bacterium]
MRKLFVLPMIALAAIALVGTACSSDDSGDSAARSSDEREGSDSGSEDSGSSDSGIPGLDDLEDQIPDLDELDDQLPNLGDLDDCFTLATEYASLYIQALGGEEGATAAQKEAEELKDVLPSDLHDDIDVVAEAIGKVASEGLLSGSEALDTPEYNSANDAISEYFDKECSDS